MSDDDDARLVADELTRLDAAADQHDTDDKALDAFIRAYAIRRLPVATAAAVLRQEAMDALAGRTRSSAAKAEPVWWLGVVAQRAGCPGWSFLPMGMEVRAVINRFKREHRSGAARAARKAPA